MEKYYKYRIYPNKKQKELIQKTFGCCRFVYNYFLDRKINEHNENNKNIRYCDFSRELTVLKNNYIWLQEPDKWALQNSLKHLDRAFELFFNNHQSFPKYKSKKNKKQSYRTQFNNNNIKFLKNHIQLPKLGNIKIRGKLVPSGRILHATVSQNAIGHYYVSLCCTNIENNQFPKTGNNIGIDLGIVNFATYSDGIKIDNPKFFEKSEKKLAKLCKELSRKTIGSSNRNKVRIKLAKLYKHIANQRMDFLQKLTTNLVREYDTICIEDLDVSSLRETDSTIRNKRISDVSLYEFRRQLQYKCQWYGKELKVIDRYYPSSQICHICGHRDCKKDEAIRKWVCPICGNELDRDINAAINILNEGLNNC